MIRSWERTTLPKGTVPFSSNENWDSPQAIRPRMIASAWLRAFCTAVLLVAGFSGCRPPAEEPARRAVTVAHPEVRKLADEDDYNGWLQASQTVDVRARVRGHIQKIDFKDGDMVKENQLLIEIDSRPFKTARDAALAQKKALEAKKDAADKNVARTKELLKARAISQQEFEQIEADALALGAEINAKRKRRPATTSMSSTRGSRPRLAAALAGPCSPRATSSTPAAPTRF